MYKVFFNQRFILLTDNISLVDIVENMKFIEVQKTTDLNAEIDIFRDDKSIEVMVLYSKDLDNLFLKFQSHFIFIEAAGGAVSNSENELLLIKRNGLWDLPKGKVEKGESYEEAALREVTEECGINNQVIISELESSYHTFVMNNQNVLKKTYWYIMSYNGSEIPVPQVEEGLTIAKWCKKEKLDNYMVNTFLSIVDVVNNSLKK